MASDDKTEPSGFDPETYRMTLGEHLEELRRRIVLGLIGLVIATGVCLLTGERVVIFFCKPLTDGLRRAGQSPQLHFTELTAPFMLYLKVSLIVAAAASGPWMLYQLWQFIAAGLYAAERKTITRYIPLSIVLLISGMCMAFFFVMPFTIRFLLLFNSGFDMPGHPASRPVDVAPSQVMVIPTFVGDPSHPVQGQIWRNSTDGLLKFFGDGKVLAVPFSTQGLLAQSLTIDGYISMMLVTLVIFGIAFQLPLVVLAVYTVGVVDIPTLRRSRKIVMFGLLVVAAILSPGDLVSGMFALWVPLALLYEMGIGLCVWTERRRRASEEGEAA